jgi:hypothetical protein
VRRRPSDGSLAEIHTAIHRLDARGGTSQA